MQWIDIETPEDDMPQENQGQQLVVVKPEQRQLAISIVNEVPHSDLLTFESWLQGLLAIERSGTSRLSKAKSAILLTLASKIIWPVVKSAAKKVKKVGWDESGTAAKFGLVGAGLGIALFGSHAAGIAALGTAIGLPLWIVLGAGSTFAGVLLEEMRRVKKTPPVITIDL